MEMSKCITISTPFGFLDLTLCGNEYESDTNDSRSSKTTRSLPNELSFEPKDDKWVSSFVMSTGNFAGWLPIVARHGNAFP